MRDLTQGSIARHLLGMAAFIGVGLVVQTLYVLIDLYFVAHLGPQAIAGVASAGATMFIVMAASQLIAVGSLALIAQAMGRKDMDDAQAVFDQAMSMSVGAALVALAVGYTAGVAYVRSVAADGPTGDAARAYLVTFLPSLALMFPMGAVGSALRGAGIVGAPMAAQVGTVLLNAILAPVLIAGWGTGAPLGVAGAGLASTIAAVAGVIAMLILFPRIQKTLVLHAARLRPDWALWRRVTMIGLPASAEFLLMFIIMAVVYVVTAPFGADAQAGFGIGQRISSSIFLPAMAVAFAAAPIAGQNFGARLPHRVRATFRAATLIGSVMMVLLTLLCQWRPEVLVHPFTTAPAVVAVATGYLRITSWNFVAIGLVFACSGMFQALGDTVPSLISSAGRLITFAIPALALHAAGGVPIEDYWYLSVASVTLQAITSIVLLRRHFARKLDMAAPPVIAPAGV